jgi:hypothetical protein
MPNSKYNDDSIQTKIPERINNPTLPSPQIIKAAAKPDPTPDKPHKRKDHIIFRISIYVSDGAYNSEMIAEFDYQASNLCDYRGHQIKDPISEVNLFLENIGKHGYIVTDNASSKKTYYPPHRIYFVDVIEVAD